MFYYRQKLFGGLSEPCDFVELAQSGNYSVVTLSAQPSDYAVTVFPAQNAFCTCPVVHQGHDLRPLLRSFRLLIHPPNSLSLLDTYGLIEQDNQFSGHLG